MISDHGVYLDSPVASAINQIDSFFAEDMFSIDHTPVFLRMRAHVRLRLLFGNLPQGIQHISVKPGSIPIAKGGVIFYPFNSQSNMNAVTNRDVSHVLTLHGESNKLASNRPAARLYDYICIAGPMARDRYLRAGIFTPAEVDQGRLVMMGTSFVQKLNWIEPARDANDGAVFYSPTWEGYGNGLDNYTSVTSQFGFKLCADAARAADAHVIIIKPHPYLGLLKPKLLVDFTQGVLALKAQGFIVKLALSDASQPLRLMASLRLRGIDKVCETGTTIQKVKLALTDVSGMEAIFLRQKIPYMTIRKDSAGGASIEQFYQNRTLNLTQDAELQIRSYLDAFDQIDGKQRRLVFGWHDEALEDKSGHERREWLLNYTRNDPYWQKSKRENV